MNVLLPVSNVGLVDIDICTSAPTPVPLTDICCAFPDSTDFCDNVYVFTKSYNP